MAFIKNLLAKKAIGFYVSAAAMVLAILTVLLYGVRGGNSYSPVSSLAVWMFVIGIVTNCAILVKDFKFGAYIPFIFYLVGFGVLFNTEMLFISNVLMDIDGNTFDALYIIIFILLILTLATSFAATIMKLEKEDKEVVAE
ncbi:MAG: hypothetical protein IJ186_01165 [Bacilli bacterium]|nr:hypothetical protein [Bacilli bacterium]